MFCFAGRSFTFFGYFYYCHVPSFQGICRILIRKLSFKHFFLVILIFFLFKHVCARQGPNPCTISLALTFLSFVLTFSFEEIVSPVFYLISTRPIGNACCERETGSSRDGEHSNDRLRSLAGPGN